MKESASTSRSVGADTPTHGRASHRSMMAVLLTRGLELTKALRRKAITGAMMGFEISFSSDVCSNFSRLQK